MTEFLDVCIPLDDNLLDADPLVTHPMEDIPIFIVKDLPVLNPTILEALISNLDFVMESSIFNNFIKVEDFVNHHQFYGLFDLNY